MCTWMVIETIDYFLRNNSEMFICTMNMTKAFDKVKHGILFQKLLKRHVPPIILRFLLHAYKIQVARWNGNYSAEFNITNGVLCFRPYSTVFTLTISFWINGEFMGIFGYADDNVLLSPTFDGLQNMLNICEQYAKEHNLSFSTNENIINVKRNVWRLLRRKGI